ncbi:MAG: NADH-quinone oxidoreductase subunit L [Planctomycetes bacterium]|jgi:NADH:ubiquinone oxidoreductase subunit F (NADH-binding)/(2Fe-2S) ferredoxin|nr:NADH-quinone oxidoreductase subunit L [Planctomycetota bacterium]
MAEKADIGTLAAEERNAQAARKARLFCCGSTGCLSSGGGAIANALTEALAGHGLADAVDVVPTGCMGLCSLGPLVRVEVPGRDPVLYKEVDPMIARLIVAEHVVPAAGAGDEGFELPAFFTEHILPMDIPFFTKQTKVVLADSGRVNPERIEDYLAADGYQALQNVLANMTPQAVIELIADSGLRGRGGGGFPTGQKWGFARQAEPVNGEKFIICNGDEGDPGAYMDRSVLEGNPHAVLEGMLIAAYATGATEGWFYIRAEYPLAVDRVEKAIKQARRNGLVGKNILGSDLNVDCQIRLGAGAFVCGEETALIHSIEGQRGTPRPRPPYPSVQGLWDRPSVVNNVETLANVPAIIRNGPEWFHAMGTETSKGTKVFALTGKVEHSGLIEVPMGMHLREIVEDIGGGNPADKPLKAVQTGGPSGGVIPVDQLDVPVCYEQLTQLGSMMGSGGMIVMDADDSMVEIAKFYLGFAVDESCGKCAPCRIGGTQMLALLQKVTDGKATLDDLDLIRRLSRAMQQASLCGLGQTAPNPVISTLRYFEDEYMEAVIVYSDPSSQDWTPRGT